MVISYPNTPVINISNMNLFDVQFRSKMAAMAIMIHTQQLSQQWVHLGTAFY